MWRITLAKSLIAGAGGNSAGHMGLLLVPDGVENSFSDSNLIKQWNGIPTNRSPGQIGSEEIFIGGENYHSTVYSNNISDLNGVKHGILYREIQPQDQKEWVLFSGSQTDAEHIYSTILNASAEFINNQKNNYTNLFSNNSNSIARTMFESLVKEGIISTTDAATIRNQITSIEFPGWERNLMADVETFDALTSDPAQGFAVLTNNSDTLVNGGHGADSINAGGGDDTIVGAGGNDTLYGGAGVDLVSYTNNDLMGIQTKRCFLIIFQHYKKFLLQRPSPNNTSLSPCPQLPGVRLL